MHEGVWVYEVCICIGMYEYECMGWYGSESLSFSHTLLTPSGELTFGVAVSSGLSLLQQSSLRSISSSYGLNLVTYKRE